ncbi:hypothetical protein PCL_05991 [Purpureocillium lilacinum]|uniref:Uncharacterized protein n=1 Tax=Purpureocillium lilacinum TaxID=33203 RepID=A0A2U3ELG9_PURLI|nr:hypothetical protein PCL_05991 [Purpureocillium lilacinum]
MAVILDNVLEHNRVRVCDKQVARVERRVGQLMAGKSCLGGPWLARRPPLLAHSSGQHLDDGHGKAKPGFVGARCANSTNTPVVMCDRSGQLPVRHGGVMADDGLELAEIADSFAEMVIDGAVNCEGGEPHQGFGTFSPDGPSGRSPTREGAPGWLAGGPHLGRSPARFSMLTARPAVRSWPWLSSLGRGGGGGGGRVALRILKQRRKAEAKRTQVFAASMAVREARHHEHDLHLRSLHVLRTGEPRTVELVLARLELSRMIRIWNAKRQPRRRLVRVFPARELGRHRKLFQLRLPGKVCLVESRLSAVGRAPPRACLWQLTASDIVVAALGVRPTQAAWWHPVQVECSSRAPGRRGTSSKAQRRPGARAEGEVDEAKQQRRPRERETSQRNTHTHSTGRLEARTFTVDADGGRPPARLPVRHPCNQPFGPLLRRTTQGSGGQPAHPKRSRATARVPWQPSMSENSAPTQPILSKQASRQGTVATLFHPRRPLADHRESQEGATAARRWLDLATPLIGPSTHPSIHPSSPWTTTTRTATLVRQPAPLLPLAVRHRRAVWARRTGRGFLPPLPTNELRHGLATSVCPTVELDGWLVARRGAREEAMGSNLSSLPRYETRRDWKEKQATSAVRTAATPARRGGLCPRDMDDETFADNGVNFERARLSEDGTIPKPDDGRVGARMVVEGGRADRQQMRNGHSGRIVSRACTQVTCLLFSPARRDTRRSDRISIPGRSSWGTRCHPFAVAGYGHRPPGGWAGAAGWPGQARPRPSGEEEEQEEKGKGEGGSGGQGGGWWWSSVRNEEDSFVPWLGQPVPHHGKPTGGRARRDEGGSFTRPGTRTARRRRRRRRRRRQEEGPDRGQGTATNNGGPRTGDKYQRGTRTPLGQAPASSRLSARPASQR